MHFHLKLIYIYEVHTISFQTFFVWALLLIKPLSLGNKQKSRRARESKELTWCPSWSNSLWQGWNCGLVNCPAGNATDPIWRVLASSDGISSWTPLKPQHSNPTLTLWTINSFVRTSLLLPHLSSSLTDSLPSLNLLCHSKTDAQFMQDGRKAVWIIPYVSVAFFQRLNQNFIAYHSSKESDCIFDFHQLWYPGLSRVYSNCYCSCFFEPEIIKIGQSPHKMFSNNILPIRKNAHTKKVWKLIVFNSYIYIYMCVCVCVCVCVCM